MNMKNKRVLIIAVILTISTVGQIVLAFLFYNGNGYTAVINTGWFVMGLSAIFGWLPIFTFRKWGGVPKDKSYMGTTQLVDRGVYAIVRHPQYLAGVLMSIALPLISQHWVVVLPGIVSVFMFYLSIYDEEGAAIAKLGEAYKEYMQRVPRLNFLLGIYRLFKKRG